MATDNVRLNVGSGGDLVRTLADADGNEWQAVVASYVQTLSPGANVLQTVDGSHGLPVAQQGTWTVGVAGTPTVNISAGQSVAISGTPSVVASQAVAADLNATVSLAAGQTLANVTTVGTVTNPVAATQSGAWTVGLSGSPVVTAAQATAADLQCTASQGGSWTVGITGTPTVNISAGQSVAATQSGAWTVGLSASQTLANVTTVGTVTNPVAATQSGAWTVGIAGIPSVSQSGSWLVGLAPGANLVGKTSTGADVSTLYDGAAALTPKFAKINAGSTGDNVVVAAVTGKKIRVLRWSATSNGTVSAKWRSNTTDLTGTLPLIQYASAGGSYCPVGIFETSAGEALNLSLSAAVLVGGMLTYVEV